MKVFVKLLSVFIAFTALGANAQTTDEYFFYAKPGLAKRKLIPASELSLCALGDTFNPPIKNQFKEIVSVGAGSRSQMLETGRCDVVMLYGQPLERAKKDYRGFAIYGVSGNNLELVAAPETGWIAVGRMELAVQDKLEKKNLEGCGDGSLRDVFRPNPRIWKGWTQRYVKFEDLKTPKQLEQENALLYGCDVWIFTPEDYASFSRKYGTKYPLFDVTPENPVLTRRK